MPRLLLVSWATGREVEKESGITQARHSEAPSSIFPYGASEKPIICGYTYTYKWTSICRRLALKIITF